MVVLLNKCLNFIEEKVASQISPLKSRYLFDGVPHFISALLIKNVYRISKINTNGVKKMCRNIFALQQNLANITLSREPAFDYCRQYYCLLALPAEVGLNQLERMSLFVIR